MTKVKFLAAYEVELIKTYFWTADEDKLKSFMDSVHHTITDGPATWNHRGDAVVAAWKSIGGKGVPTLKAIRALP
jgi:hypothetical protein